MNDKTALYMAFITGVAVGAAATWLHFKKKYEQFTPDESEVEDQEIPGSISLRDAEYEQKYHTPIKAGYEIKLHEYGYVNDSEASVREDDNGQKKQPDKPRIITPEEFGEIDDYETISLTYYADKILVDENDDPIEDADTVVGFESLAHFGEYEDDSVFVRNDRLRCDYEILLDSRRYSEVVGRKPHHPEAP